MCPPSYHQNGLLVIHALCVNHTSYAQVHELLKGHCGDNWESTLFVLYIYIYVCIYIYIYIYIYIIFDALCGVKVKIEKTLLLQAVTGNLSQ